MIPADALAAFTGVALLLCIAPGPDNLFVLLQSMLYGRAAGICVTLGLCTGLVIHSAAVSVGIAALLQASPTAFDLVRFAGAAWLFWLAWQAFTAGAVRVEDGRTGRLTAWQYYRRGIIMNVTNPKVMLFFLALLPQFADPAYGSVAAQVLLLGAVFMLCTLLVFGSAALLAARIGARLRSSTRLHQALHYTAGVVYMGIAVRLLLIEM